MNQLKLQFHTTARGRLRASRPARTGQQQHAATRPWTGEREGRRLREVAISGEISGAEREEEATTSSRQSDASSNDWGSSTHAGGESAEEAG